MTFIRLKELSLLYDTCAALGHSETKSGYGSAELNEKW